VKYMQLQELQDAVGNAAAKVREAVEEMEQVGASDDDGMKVNVISFSSSSSSSSDDE